MESGGYGSSNFETVSGWTKMILLFNKTVYLCKEHLYELLDSLILSVAKTVTL